MICTASSPALAVEVHDQGDVLQIGLQGLEGAHRLDQLLEVLQPGLAGRALVEAQGVGVAALLQDGLHQARVRQCARPRRASGRGRAGSWPARCGCAPASSSVRTSSRAAGAGRDAVRPRPTCSSFCDGGVADAALGHVDDALEGQVVVRATGSAADRRGRRGSRPARRTAGRRSPCRGSAAARTALRRPASGSEARTRMAMSR